jgi:hypothetical protein
MGQLLGISVGKWRFVLVACAALAVLSVSGCGNSQAYKEGYDNGFHFSREMRRNGAVGSLDEKGGDPEDIEAETGTHMIPYPKGSSDRKEWVRGYKEGLKAGW